MRLRPAASRVGRPLLPPVRPERSREAPAQPAQPAGAPAERATNYRPVASAGEASVDGAEEDAAAAWLAHVQAGRIGG